MPLVVPGTTVFTSAISLLLSIVRRGNTLNYSTDDDEHIPDSRSELASVSIGDIWSFKASAVCPTRNNKKRDIPTRIAARDPN
jgi:hypothetical protein